MSAAGLGAAVTALALLVIAGCASVVPDYAREQSLAGEAAPAKVVGESVMLEAGGGRKFLGLLTPASHAGQKGGAACFHGLGKGAGHGHGVTGHRDGRVDQYRVGSHLHCKVCVRGGTDAGVYHHRNPGLVNDDRMQRVGVRIKRTGYAGHCAWRWRELDTKTPRITTR